MPINKFSPAAQKVLNAALAGAASQHERLRNWAAANLPNVGAGLVLGSIVWDKELGRPSSPAMSDCFVIALSTSKRQAIGSPGDGGGVDTWINSPPIVVNKKWDDEGESMHIVHFLHVVVTGEQLHVGVSFEPGVAWEGSNPGGSPEHLLVSPSGRGYGFGLSSSIIPNWIEPFRVIRAVDSPSVFRTP